MLKLNHIALVSSSLENADRFYRGILGLERKKTSSLDQELTERIFGIADQCRVVLYGNKGFTVEMFLPDSGLRMASPFGHICLEMEDRDQFLEKCWTNGLAVKQIPKGDSVVIFVSDFDGNMFEIKELKAGR